MQPYPFIHQEYHIHVFSLRKSILGKLTGLVYGVAATSLELVELYLVTASIF